MFVGIVIALACVALAALNYGVLTSTPKRRRRRYL